jgi:DNA-binding response OmpR family regulator
VHEAATPTIGPILVVEPDTDVRELVAEFLTKWGYAVNTAGTGSAAFDQVAIAWPAIVVTELDLPDQNGLELVLALRRILNRPAFAAVALSVFPLASYRRLHLDDAFALLVPKPFDSATLRSAIDACTRSLHASAQ